MMNAPNGDYSQQQWQLPRAVYVGETGNTLLPPDIVADSDYRPPIDRYCSTCANILDHSESLDKFAQNGYFEQAIPEIWPHQPGIQALFASGRQGCHLCSLLYTQAVSFETAEMPEDQLYLCIKSAAFRYDFQLGIIDKHGTTNGTSLMWEYPTPHRELGDDASPWRTSSTSSRCTLDLANEWLKACQQEHVACSTQKIFLSDRPGRLLHISGTIETPEIRLIECSVDNQDIPYITLSHCWGSKLSLTLQKSSLSQFLVEIPFNELPRTFQDAVNITQRLGCRALWIDALCIMQDSEIDKEREIPKMGSIYGNSICTVAASSSHNSTQGCYAPRLPLSHIHCHIRTLSGWLIQVSCPRIPRIRGEIRPEASMGMSDGPPLFQRGWVVQERALSPRTLYFSGQDIYWECCTTVLSEQDHVRLQSGGPLDRLKSDIGSVAGGREIGHTNGSVSCVASSDKWHQQWWRLVRVYSRCLLTKTSDRWPAIAGIALFYQEAIGTKLLAGMWQHTLHRDILWEVGGMSSSNRARNRLNNGYPSWSWLSVDARVFLDQYVLDLREDNFTLKFQNLPKASVSVNDVFAEAKSQDMKLVITAPAARIPVYRPEEEDTYKCQSMVEVALRSLSEGEWNVDVWWDSVDPDTRDGLGNMSGERELWAVQCTRATNCTRFLIVERTLDKNNSWQRVGCAKFEHYRWADRLVSGDGMVDITIGPWTELCLY